MSFKCTVGVLDLVSVYVYLLEIYFYIPCVPYVITNKRKTENSEV